MEDCLSNSQMYWVNDTCRKRPTIEVKCTSKEETDPTISQIEKCNSHVNSIFYDGFCYYFYNGYQTYDNAQSICYEHFKHMGMGNGRLYEPRIPSNHRFVYKAAIEISGLPNPPIWIGITDKKREGDFRYHSDNSPIPLEAPL